MDRKSLHTDVSIPPARNADGVLPKPSGAASRERILSTAASLFSKKGYAATSVREIADASGLTKPAVYYHFQSKLGLFNALLAGCEVKVDRILSRTGETAGAPWEKLDRLCCDLVSLMGEDAYIRQVIQASFLGPMDIPPFGGSSRLRTRIESAVRRHLLASQHAGRSLGTNIDDTLRMVLGIVPMSAAGGRRLRDRSDRKDAASRLLKLTLHGLDSTIRDDIPPSTGEGPRTFVGKNGKRNTSHKKRT